MMDPLQRQPRGFTLIEILTVVVILGIAAAVVIPNLGTRDDLNAAAAARMVMADLIYAQSQAITNQQTTYVRFTTTGSGTYCLVTAAPATGSTLTYMTNPVTQSNYVETFGTPGTNGLGSSSLTSASFDGQTVLAFDELGTPLSYNPATNSSSAMVNGSVVVTSGTFPLTITIEAYTGALSVN
jgi:prepilin-type N-terminal cleavage/methylation domain-containing protein